MDTIVLAKILPITILVSVVLRLIMDVFFYNQKINILIYVLLVFASAACFLTKTDFNIGLMLFYLLLTTFYALEYASNKLKYVKVFLAAIGSLFVFAYINVPESQRISLFLIVNLFLLLPYRSQEEISKENRLLTKTSHLLLQLLIVSLLQAITWSAGTSLLLAASVIIFFSASRIFHRTYNKNNEDLFITTLIFLLAISGTIPLVLVCIFIGLNYLAELKNADSYGHNRDSLVMSTWFTLTGVKTFLAILLIHMSSETAFEIKIVLYAYTFIIVAMSTFRPQQVNIEAMNCKKNYGLQVVLWLILVLCFIGGQLATGI